MACVHSYASMPPCHGTMKITCTIWLPGQHGIAEYSMLPGGVLHSARCKLAHGSLCVASTEFRQINTIDLESPQKFSLFQPPVPVSGDTLRDSLPLSSRGYLGNIMEAECEISQTVLVI